jgi:cell division protein FtsI (penicillin-binding protein 3)
MVSFCGYFPSEAPKYSCIVCIVKDGLPASGGGQCVPVFSQISQYIMTQGFNREAKELSDSTSVFIPATKTSRSEDNGDLTRVPDVKGMGAKDAVYLLKKRGLTVSLQGMGMVKSQSIAPGEQITEGQQIRLVLE